MTRTIGGATNAHDDAPVLRAVLFDMDGTLVDSHAAVARTWAYWSGLRGVDPRQIARVAPGRPVLESLAALAPWLSDADRRSDAAELLRLEREDLVDVGPTPGALDLLAALDHWSVPYAVVTSADDSLARARLGAARIVAPEVLVTASVVARGKPDPEGYLLAAGLLGVRPDSCLVVEDTVTGAVAGRDAGAFTVGVGEVEAAHVCVPHLGDLHRRLDRAGTGGLRIQRTDPATRVASARVGTPSSR